ncbi:MAG: hypothetical protein AAFO69_12795 [Bacteroidota bacterium]
MNTKVVTSVVATMTLGVFAFFNNLPQKVIRSSQAKIVKSKRTTPLKRAEDDSFDLFI